MFRQPELPSCGSLFSDESSDVVRVKKRSRGGCVYVYVYIQREVDLRMGPTGLYSAVGLRRASSLIQVGGEG